VTTKGKTKVKKAGVGVAILLSLGGFSKMGSDAITVVKDFMKQKDHQEAWVNNKNDKQDEEIAYLKLQIDSLKNK